MTERLVHPILGSARKNAKGYWRLNGGIHRDEYLHRAVFALAAGRPVLPGHQIHHQPGSSKSCTCPHMYIEIQSCLHPTPEPPRCPHTGRFLNAREVAMYA